MVYIKCLSKQISITATFSFHHRSFDVILSIMLTSGNINLFCLCISPPSRNNQLIDPCFFSDFLFHLCSTLSSSSVILGDLSVHFDIPTNPLVKNISSLLNRDSFYQAVTVPTHNSYLITYS